MTYEQNLRERAIEIAKLALQGVYKEMGYKNYDEISETDREEVIDVLGIPIARLMLRKEAEAYRDGLLKGNKYQALAITEDSPFIQFTLQRICLTEK